MIASQPTLSSDERNDIARRIQKFSQIRTKSYPLEECLALVELNDKNVFKEDKNNLLEAFIQHEPKIGIEAATQLFEFYYADDSVGRSKLMGIWKKFADKAEAGSRHLAILWRQLGMLENSQGNLESALVYFSSSIAIQEALGDALMLGNDYYELGLVHRNRGNYEEAWEAFNQSIRYARQEGNLKTVIYSQGQLANILAVQSRFAEAVKILQESLETWEQFPGEVDRNMRHTTLHTLGRTYLQNGQFREAKETLLGSLRLKEQVQERFDATLRTRAMLAEACIQLGEFEEAEHHLTEEGAVRGEKIGSYLYAASAFKALSQLKFAQLEFAEARRLAYRAMTVAEKSNTPLTELEAALWLASLHARRFDLFDFIGVLPRLMHAFLRLRLSLLEILKLALKRLAVTLNPIRARFCRG
jgi:tetratricopeptide (TPR) repeat protein